MQVLNTGTIYRIYDESMKAFDQIPAGVYKINFHPQMGYSLIKTDSIVIEEKIYGNHEQKVEKVYNAFKIFPRNLGIILSGKKGIGKSLFAKLLSIKAVENGYPIIICEAHTPGIADFLGSIQQEIIVLFDEFDKTFYDKETDVQAEMLTLFDGLYMGKKMFVITCNELNKLNDYLVNRPGRFHYHFRFECPTDEEIVEYMRDNVLEEYWGEINAVTAFSKKVELNFDCLRAIAFELNMGSTFKEAAEDLNIVNIEPIRYDATVYFKNGTIFKCVGMYVDMFEDSIVNYWFSANNMPSPFIEFNPSDNLYDYSKGAMIINGAEVNLVKWDYDPSYECTDEEEKQNKIKAEELEKVGIDFILFKRRYNDKNFHYSV